MKGDVVAVAGPWRTSGDWWREESWAQDEWDVEIRMNGSRVSDFGCRVPKPESRTPNPGLYRLYRDVASGQWFVRGCYD